MTSAIIVAAGKGLRMGGLQTALGKLFIEIAGKPVIAHSWQRFDGAKEIDEIILVIRDETRGEFQELAQRNRFKKPFRLVTGGTERQDSVWNGLEALSPKVEVVAIQDAARPCTDEALINATIAAAREMGAAVAAQAVTDTIKESANGQTIQKNLDRSKLWAVQTPQTFRVEVIRRALLEVKKRGLQITDDTAACELIGQPVKLVASASPNPKVTTQADVKYIEAILSGK